MKINLKLVDDIKKRALKLAPNVNMEKAKKNFEKIVKSRYRKCEPSLVKFYQGLRKKAVRLGVPMHTVEARIHDSYEMTVSSLEKVGINLTFFSTGKKTSRKARKQTKKKTPKKTRAKPANSKA